MKHKSRSIDYQVFNDRVELPPGEAHLLEQAWLATEEAHAPYSHFRVGCAVSLLDGRIILGNNQGNYRLLELNVNQVINFGKRELECWKV